jgi:hypothetical protein
MKQEEIESIGWQLYDDQRRYRANFYNERMGCTAIMEMIYHPDSNWCLIYDLRSNYKPSETRFAGHIESVENLKLLMGWIGMDKVPPDNSDYEKEKSRWQNPLTPDQCFKP